MVTQFLLDVLSLTIPAYLWEEWKRLVDLETDLCNEARASVLSAEMSDVNKLRTAELSNLFRQIKRFARSGNSEFMRAAAQLMTLVNAYAGIQRKKRVEKSGLIIGLIIDLRKPENASCVEVLNIGSLVDQLETYNNRFEELHEQRVNYYADKIQEKMAELRPKTDVCYQKVCILIEAAFINAVTNEERESLSGLISRINETYNSMGIGRKKRRNKKIDADSAANIAANTGSDDANVTDGQTPADESSTPSTPAGDEGANEGSQDGSQSDTHEGDQGEGQGSEQPSAPDTGGFMG